jgi:hypothetical protein
MFEDIDSGQRIILQALSLAKDCYRLKADLIGSKTTVDKAAKLIRMRKAETQTEVTRAQIMQIGEDVTSMNR